MLIIHKLSFFFLGLREGFDLLLGVVGAEKDAEDCFEDGMNVSAIVDVLLDNCQSLEGEDIVDDGFGPFWNQVESLDSYAFEEFQQLDQVKFHAFGVSKSIEVYLLSMQRSKSWQMDTRFKPYEHDNFRAIFNASQHFLFLCNFLCSIPFLRQIIAVSSFFGREKLATSTYRNFISHISKEFCNLTSSQRSMNSFSKFIPQRILDYTRFQSAGLRVVVTLALHFGRQKDEPCYQCQLRLPSKDYCSDLLAAYSCRSLPLPSQYSSSISSQLSIFFYYSCISEFSSNFSQKNEQLSLNYLLVGGLNISSFLLKSLSSQKESVLYFINVFHPFIFSYPIKISQNNGFLFKLQSILSSMFEVKPSLEFFLSKF